MHKQPTQPVCFQEPLAVPAPATLPAHSEALRIGDPLSTQGVSILSLSDLPNGLGLETKPGSTWFASSPPRLGFSLMNLDKPSVRITSDWKEEIWKGRKSEKVWSGKRRSRKRKKNAFYRTEPKGLQKDHVEALYKFSMIVLQVLNTCDSWLCGTTSTHWFPYFESRDFLG